LQASAIKIALSPDSKISKSNIPDKAANHSGLNIPANIDSITANQTPFSVKNKYQKDLALHAARRPPVRQGLAY
jgi:hypothetical protein